jgi:DNA-binding CsgD family transcriptional regulator
MVMLLHSLADLVILGDPEPADLRAKIVNLLRSDPDRDQVSGEMLHLLALPHWPSQPRRVASFAMEAVEVATTMRRYRLRRMRLPRGVLGPNPVCVVLVECHLPAVPPPEALAEQFGLTPREAHVAELLASRLSTKEIGAALGISVHTVRRHVESILRKIGVRSRFAVADAMRGICPKHQMRE